MKELIDNKDYEAIRQALSGNPDLANEGLPYDKVNITKCHPLHRLCDGVFSKTYTEEEAIKMAQLFLAHGADIDGGRLIENKDTPLIAAASLYADKVAFFYIDNGAIINHAGCSGGTALHWAAWCGRNELVKRLIDEKAEINRLCADFKATPLFWAVRGAKNEDENNRQNYTACIKILLQAGADKNIPNKEGKTVFGLLTNGNAELQELLNKA